MIDPQISVRIAQRLDIGRERYGHGVLVPENASMNWKTELAEELLDACVYAAAEVLKNRGVERDDDNSQILELIRSRQTATYEYGSNDRDLEILDLCMFVASALEKNVST